MTDSATYNLWISSSQTTRAMTSYEDDSPNSQFGATIQFPKAPHGHTYAMRCTAFKIDAPTGGATRGKWDPLNEPTTSLSEAGFGMLGIATQLGMGTPAFTAQSTNNALVNWFREDPIPLALFDAETGDDMQSQWTLITPPLASSNILFTVRSSTTTSFLVNRASGTNNLAPLDNWTACLSFKSMSNSALEQYYPFQPDKVSGGDITINYPATFPTAPISEILNNSSAVGTVQFDDAWLDLSKTESSGNIYWRSSYVTVHLGNTSGSTVYLEADVYHQITNAASTDPAVAFAGKTVEYTTASVEVPSDGGTTGRDFVLTGDDRGFYNTYLVFKVVGGSGTLPAGVVVEFENDSEPPLSAVGLGASNGNIGNYNFNYYASPD